MSHINKMVQAARDSNPAAFNTAFHSALGDKIGQAINDRRFDVVSDMFGIKESVEDGEKCTCGKNPDGKCTCEKKD